MPPRTGIETTPFGISFYSDEPLHSDGWRIYISSHNSKIEFEKCDEFPYPYYNSGNIADEDFEKVFG